MSENATKKHYDLNTIDNYPVVARFLRRKADKTRESYKSTLGIFFRFLNVNPEEYIKDIRNLDNGERTKAIDHYTEDVERFWDSLKGKSPMTITVYLGVVRKFFRYNDIELKNSTMDDLKKQGKKSHPLTQEKPLTRQLIAKILEHATVMEKAYFLSLASSGSRKGELLQITLKDVHWGSPTKIDLIDDPDQNRTIKNHQTRTTFISDEATGFLKEWLTVREHYITQAVKKTHGLKTFHGTVTKDLKDDRIFPFSESVAQVIWMRLCKRAGIYEKDDRTGISKCRIHMLRKFFKSYFQVPDYSKNEPFINTLVGHSSLETTYFRPEELDELYKQGMQSVTIFNHTPENAEVIEQLQQENEAFRKKQLEMETQLFVIQGYIDQTVTKKDGTKFTVREQWGPSDESVKNGYPYSQAQAEDEAIGTSS